MIGLPLAHFVECITCGFKVQTKSEADSWRVWREHCREKHRYAEGRHGRAKRDG